MPEPDPQHLLGKWKGIRPNTVDHLDLVNKNLGTAYKYSMTCRQYEITNHGAKKDITELLYFEQWVSDPYQAEKVGSDPVPQETAGSATLLLGNTR